MNLKKRTLLKLALVMSLLVVNVIAATPGSSCTIRARVLFINVNLSGRVSTTNRCIPLSLPLDGLLDALGTGVICNQPADVIIGIIRASASCPN
jgi:hypothetical protein